MRQSNLAARLATLCLGVLVLLVPLEALGGTPSAGPSDCNADAQTCALLRACYSEIIPSLSECLGRLLVDYFYESYTQDELIEMARYGVTPCVRTAATEALKRHRIFVDPFAELIAAYSLDELRDMGETDLTAARAYYFRIRGDVTVESLEADAAGMGPLAIAAGELLGGYYAAGGGTPPAVDEMIDLMENGASPGLRLAGGIALVTFILTGWSDYGEDLTDEDLVAGLVAAAGWDLGRSHVYQILYCMRFAR